MLSINGETVVHAQLYVYDSGTLAFASMTQPGASTTLAASTVNIGDVDVLTLPALPAGTNNIGNVGQSGVWTMQPGNTANTVAWLVNGSGVTQPVSGTFWQATQPVSGTFWQATQPVSGTFWQATQPVSGTFWQATQPVSGTVTANPATSFGKTITYVSVNQSAAGTTVLAAASVGNKHKVVGVTLVLSVLGTLKLTDGVADLTGPMDLAANAGFVWPTSLLPYTETGATNRALNLITTLGAARGVVAILTEA